MSAIERITKAELLNHLTQLDVEASRWRFGCSVSPESMAIYVNGISDDDIILGIKPSIVSDTIAAAIHLSFNKEDNSAEMGISTLNTHRRRGYAERLLRYSVDILRNRNISHLYSVCLPDNVPLMKMLQKLNITAVYNNDVDREARIVIPMAGIDSIMHEVKNERLVIIDKTMRPWAQLWSQMFSIKNTEN
jgi:hypothetical protein